MWLRECSQRLTRGISVQLAHKFNVKTALEHCDVYLAKRAAEDENFLQMGTVWPTWVEGRVLSTAFCPALQ